MSDETEQTSNEYASNGDKELLKGCVGCGCDEESAPATTVHVSTSVGNVYFNLSMTVFNDVPESRPLDAQLLKNILKVMLNELRYKYATIIRGRTEEREKERSREILKKMGGIGKAFAQSFRQAKEAQQSGEAQEEKPEAVMPDETQAEVGRRINNLFKKDGRE